MSFKESNLFGNESNDSVKHGKRKEGYKIVLEEKDPSSMFKVPVHVGDCPLCSGAVYSENDPSDDPSMSERCSKCTWWQNQFLSWDDINGFLEPDEKEVWDSTNIGVRNPIISNKSDGHYIPMDFDGDKF